jgi:hypothetical protein
MHDFERVLLMFDFLFPIAADGIGIAIPMRAAQGGGAYRMAADKKR